MRKDEAEAAIRSLGTQWAATLSSDDRAHPSFLTFKTRMQNNGYGGYLNFRTVFGADFNADMWFDDELGQNWRR